VEREFLHKEYLVFSASNQYIKARENKACETT